MEQPKKVRKHTTSAEVRNRWNNAHYDRVNITIPKGYRELFTEYCENNGTTMNATLCAIVKFAVENYREKKERET